MTHSLRTLALCIIMAMVLSGCIDSDAEPVPAQRGDVDFRLSIDPMTVADWNEATATYVAINRVDWPVVITFPPECATLEVKPPTMEPVTMHCPVAYNVIGTGKVSMDPGASINRTIRLSGYTSDSNPYAEEWFGSEGTYFLRATWVKDHPATDWADVKYEPRENA